MSVYQIHNKLCWFVPLAPILFYFLTLWCNVSKSQFGYLTGLLGAKGIHRGHLNSIVLEFNQNKQDAVKYLHNEAQHNKKKLTALESHWIYAWAWFKIIP